MENKIRPDNPYSQLLTDVSSYVTSYFGSHDNAKYVYHTLKHTEMVVEKANFLATHYRLNDDDYFVVLCAAWFHDTGYFERPDDHVQQSVEIAINFLKSKNINGDIKQKIIATILATKFPCNPQNLLEQIICDADLFYIGTDAFKIHDQLFRKEKELSIGKKISKTEWRRSTIDFFKTHKFHTDYCRKELSETKDSHLLGLLTQ